MLIYCFKPIVNDFSRVIILGSIPGRESLRKNMYYGFNRNQFWRIIFDIFNERIDEDYNKKIKFLLDRQIALWDVLESCNREGSLDSNIKDEKVNNFEVFFNKYRNIEHIFFNGTKTMNIFNKYYKNDFSNINRILLPSTSPANTISYSKKLSKWKLIREKLKED